MSKNYTWMMMTYYCPTHGSLDRSEPINVARNDLKNATIRSHKTNDIKLT